MAVADLVMCAGSVISGTVPDRCGACDGDGDDAVTVDELVDAVGNALNGCAVAPSPTRVAAAPATDGPAPAASVTPTPRMGLGCGGAGRKPCLARGTGALPTCVVDESVGVGEISRSTVGAEDRIGGINCSTKGGGRGAPERVYEFVVPVTGRYEIAVRGQGFQPLLHAKRGDCAGEFLACSAGNPLRPAVITVPSEPGAELVARESIAIVVDGNGPVPGANPPRGQQGPFALAIRPLLPDLAIVDVSVSPAVTAGDSVVTSVAVINGGEVAPGAFAAALGFARDPAAAQPLGEEVVVCEVQGGLAPQATTVCRPTAALEVPRVRAWSAFAVARVDSGDEVAEGDESNNVEALAVSIDARGFDPAAAPADSGRADADTDACVRTM